jgi:succinoglycan biosynthesis transport protein ExoP
MEKHNPTTLGPSMELGDIYYTLFRHKWKIILCSVAGLGVAGLFYRLQPPPYLSEAKLFIRYVVKEGRSTNPGRDSEVRISPDERGENIINSEVEVLTSLDLAEQVARKIGPEKILAKIGGGKDAFEAAARVRLSLIVEVPPKSSVIRVAFQHPDPEIVQPVLREYVDSYLKKHVEIHRAVGIVGDFLTQETDQLRARLAQTEEELRKATNKAGVISLEDSKRANAAQIDRIRQQVFDAQAALAERISVFQDMTKRAPVATATSESGPPAVVPPEQVNAYQKIATRLEGLRKREQDSLVQFTEENPRVKEIRVLLAEAEEQKKRLETEFPALAQLHVATSATPNQAAGGFDPVAESAQITALQAKIKVLNSQLDEIRAEAARVDQLEISILELRRRKELEEANYRYYSASLEQSRINEALGEGRVSNISQIETPTPATKNWKKTYQILAGITAGGISCGLVWAFMIELFLDTSVRRSLISSEPSGSRYFSPFPKSARPGVPAGAGRFLPRRSRCLIPRALRQRRWTAPLPHLR